MKSAAVLPGQELSIEVHRVTAEYHNAQSLAPPEVYALCGYLLGKDRPVPPSTLNGYRQYIPQVPPYQDWPWIYVNRLYRLVVVKSRGIHKKAAFALEEVDREWALSLLEQKGIRFSDDFAGDEVLDSAIAKVPPSELPKGLRKTMISLGIPYLLPLSPEAVRNLVKK